MQVAILAALSHTAHAGACVVPPGGPAACNSCNIPTIQQAINGAAPGSSIYVDATIEHSIIVDRELSIEGFSGSLSGSFTGSGPQLHGSFNPLFITNGRGKLRLSASSPAVNQCSNAMFDDIDGEIRDVTPDMGGYEVP